MKICASIGTEADNYSMRRSASIVRLLALVVCLAACSSPGRAFRVYNNTTGNPAGSALIVLVRSDAGSTTYRVQPQEVVLVAGSNDPTPTEVRIATDACATIATVSNPPPDGALIVIDPGFEVSVSEERSTIGAHASPGLSESPCR
jgi:hypothetical protein